MKRLHCYLPGLICFFFLWNASLLSAQWESLGCPESSHALSLDAEGDTLVALTTSGLFFSSDNAASWSSITTPGNLYMFDEIQIEQGSLYLTIYNFIATEQVFIIKREVYRSDDWGDGWQLITGTIDPMNGLARLLISNDTVYHVGYGSMQISFDKGNTWTVNQLVPFGLKDAFFLHNHDLYTTTPTSSDNHVIHSGDLGATWDTVYSAGQFDKSISGVTSVNNVLWVTEYTVSDTFNVISNSTDHGTTWTILDSVAVSYYSLLRSRVIGDESNLYIVDINQIERFFWSPDNGVTWHQREIEITSNSPLCANNLLLMANEAGIIFSEDQGITFSKATNGVTGATIIDFAHSGSTLWTNANNAMHVLDQGNGQWSTSSTLQNIENTLDGHLIATINSIPHISSDGGQTWVPIPPASFDNPFYHPGATYQAAGNMMYCVTNGDSSFYSTDYGNSWYELTSNHWINDPNVKITFQDGKYLAVDVYNRLWKSDDGITWEYVEVILSDPPLDFYLFHHLHPYYYIASDTFLARAHVDSLEWLIIPSPPGNNMVPFQPHVNHYVLQNHGQMLIASSYGAGVYASLDFGHNWYSVNTGLDDLQCTSLSVLGTELYLGVDGGVWKRPLADLAPFQYEGIVFLDTNVNGQKDPGEGGANAIPVRKTNQGVTTFSKTDGTFRVLSDSDVTDQLEALSPSPHATVTTPPVQITGSEDSLYFGIYYTPGIYDGVMILTNNTPVRPGFETEFTITYKNKGTETANIEINCVLPVELEFISASLPPSFIGDTLKWFIPDVLPDQSGNINVIVRLHESTPIGTLLYVFANTPVTENGDYNPEDNVDELLLTVVGSFDPNDKAVYPSGYISPVMIADTQRLEYTIRFQNTGNYPATFVQIQDTLSSNLDLTSLEILSASHDFTWKLLSGNVLDVFFENINLPDSTSDERGSHGFIKFAINAKLTLQLADQIKNKAYIYFDYNLPVVTNTVGSTVGFETSIREPEKRLLLTASPIPSKDYVVVSIETDDIPGEFVLTLYNANGILVKTQPSASNENILVDLRDLPSGFYFLQAQTRDQIGVIKLIKSQ